MLARTAGAPARPGGQTPRARAEAPRALAAIIGGPEERAGLIAHADGLSTTSGASEALARQGVIFSDLSAAVRAHPDLVREHLMSTISDWDGHKFRALHGALWSGGTFLYVPRGVEVVLPLVVHTWLGTPRGAILPHALV